MTNEKIKNSSGITLIALVLTIIVLLILAAVSIAMLTGDNSILNRATQAKTNTGLGQIDEKIKLANAAAITRGQGTLDYDILKEELAKVLGREGEDWTISAKETNPWIVTVDGKEYPLSTRGMTGGGQQGGGSEDEVTELSIELTRTHQDVVPSVGGNVGELKSFEEQVGNETITVKVPIPTDFYYVGGDRNTGIVISDNSVDENKGTSASLVGNQFVWVPVEQNQKLSLVVKSPENITSIKLIDPAGAEMSIGVSEPIGKTFSNTSITPTYNGLYTAEVTIGEEKTTETLVVRSLYAQDAFNDYFTDEWYASEDCLNKWKVLTSTTTKEQLYETLGNLEDDAAFITFAKQNVYTTYTISGFSAPTENYSTSVNTYGGFYVGRYEGGNDNETLVSKANVDPYINVTRSQASELAEKMYETAGISHLLTGAAWDRTLGWLVNTNNKTLKQINAYSIEWGNYSDDGFSETTELAKTGEFSQTKANNIYDLAGNAYEWTSENSSESDSPCVYRGGCYSNSGAYEPASFRGINGENVYYPIKYGFRVALFL